MTFSHAQSSTKPRGLVKRFASDLWSTLLDILYPRFCFSCGAALNALPGLVVCTDCRSRIEFLSHDCVCKKCGNPMGPFAETEKGCVDCKNRRFFFTKAVAAARYAGPLRDIILEMKLGRRPDVTGFLAELLIDSLSHCDFLDRVEVIVPVPLHKKRLMWRGFNQAELIARRVSKKFGIPLSSGNVIRNVETRTQARMSQPARFLNVRDAFVLKRPNEFKGKTVLLIDDVLTTGATASECARVIAAAGAVDIYVATVGR